MHPVKFQWVLDGYIQRERNRMTANAQLAIMIGATVMSKKRHWKTSDLVSFDNGESVNVPFMADTSGQTISDVPVMRLADVKTPEDLKIFNQQIDEDFARVRNSPTYKKRVYSDMDTLRKETGL